MLICLAISASLVCGAQVKTRCDQPYPCVPEGTDEVIVWHERIHVSYNRILHIPNWVSYVVRSGEAQDLSGSAKPAPVEDPFIDGTFSEGYISAHGYRAGYLIPSQPVSSTLCPFRPEALKVWRQIDAKCLEWAERFGFVIVTCATDQRPTLKNKSCGEIVPPRVFYKTVFAKVNGHYEGIGFIVVNTPLDVELVLEECLCPVSMLEYLSDYKMFPPYEVRYRPDIWE